MDNLMETILLKNLYGQFDGNYTLENFYGHFVENYTLDQIDGNYTLEKLVWTIL